MVAREFPNLEWLKQQANLGFSNRQGIKGIMFRQTGWPSVVMNATTRQAYRDNIRGPFSIFTNVSGISEVIADKKRAVIRDDFFFVTNQDQYYTLAIDQKTSVETCNVHFGQFFAIEVLQSLRQTNEQNLDNLIVNPNDFNFHNRLYRKSDQVNELLFRLRTVEESILEEELLYQLMVEILREDESTKKILFNLKPVKLSTRQEVLKRLVSAVDYIYAYHDRDVSLDEIANIACLSKFHFIRLFKSAFAKSPHQFISEVKMERAKQLLRGNREVREVGRILGFKDPSSFSRMFFKHHGVYPTQLRTI